jgi:hypothetical protein
MLNFNRNKQINPKISKYIKEQTNKSLEKYLHIKAYNIKAYNLCYNLR